MAAAWKEWERRVATAFGGSRRGPHVGNGQVGSGRNDVVGVPALSIECKHGKKLGYADCLRAVQEAEAAADNGQVAVGAMHRKGDRGGIVVLRLETFAELVRHLGVTQTGVS